MSRQPQPDCLPTPETEAMEALLILPPRPYVETLAQAHRDRVERRRTCFLFRDAG